MKKFIVIAMGFVLLIGSTAAAQQFTWGCPRDWAGCGKGEFAPCEFPPMLNPCAVPCRPPDIQKQAVPCAYKTACPSARLPCHGVSYAVNPYPIFR